MLEALYYINIGNFEGASQVFYRAIDIAYSMRLPQAACKIGGHVEFICFRFIYCGRFLSLMTSRQSTVADNSFVGEHELARNMPLGRLERIHVLVSGNITERNLRLQRRMRTKENSGHLYDGYSDTSRIDYKLKQAARSLPVRWWMPMCLIFPAFLSSTMA